MKPGAGSSIQGWPQLRCSGGRKAPREATRSTALSKVNRSPGSPVPGAEVAAIGRGGLPGKRAVRGLSGGDSQRSAASITRRPRRVRTAGPSTALRAG